MIDKNMKSLHPGFKKKIIALNSFCFIICDMPWFCREDRGVVFHCLFEYFEFLVLFFRLVSLKARNIILRRWVKNYPHFHQAFVFPTAFCLPLPIVGMVVATLSKSELHCSSYSANMAPPLITLWQHQEIWRTQPQTHEQKVLRQA